MSEVIKKSSYRPSKFLEVQSRDVEIFKFLDRVGYATLAHITRYITDGQDEKSQAAIKRRLYVLRTFNYIKIISTHLGKYYALDSKGRMGNALISSIKLDQLEHHDFLTELFFLARAADVAVLAERECIAKYKVVGKKGKVPDMEIAGWIVEFERTSKSVIDSKLVVEYWTREQEQKLCVICENDEIKNRYTAFLNPRMRIVAKKNYNALLTVLAEAVPAAQPVSPQPTVDSYSANTNQSVNNSAVVEKDMAHTQYQESIINKYR